MRTPLCLVICLVACATPGTDGSSTQHETEVSVVSVGEGFPKIIWVQSGTVRVYHTVSNGRLRATTLKGVDPTNRHLQYSWERDGAYEVEVSGRYEHGVLGAVISGGRIESRLTYRVRPDSIHAAGGG